MPSLEQYVFVCVAKFAFWACACQWCLTIHLTIIIFQTQVVNWVKKKKKLLKSICDSSGDMCPHGIPPIRKRLALAPTVPSKRNCSVNSMRIFGFWTPVKELSTGVRADIWPTATPNLALSSAKRSSTVLLDHITFTWGDRTALIYKLELDLIRLNEFPLCLL